MSKPSSPWPKSPVAIWASSARLRRRRSLEYLQYSALRSSLHPARIHPFPSPVAYWIGSVLVYQTNLRIFSDPPLTDLAAVSDDGTQAGVLATDTTAATVGRTPATRLFYARPSSSGSGVYMFAPPISPSR